MLTPLAGLAPEQIDPAERSLWRYQAVLPVAREHRISLGEGWTPMTTMFGSTTITSEVPRWGDQSGLEGPGPWLGG